MAKIIVINHLKKDLIAYVHRHCIFWRRRKFSLNYNDILVILCKPQRFKLVIYKKKCSRDMSGLSEIVACFSLLHFFCFLVCFMAHTIGTSMPIQCQGALWWCWDFFNIMRAFLGGIMVTWLIWNGTLTLRKKCLYSELFWSECRKMRTRITPNMDTFYAVRISLRK